MIYYLSPVGLLVLWLFYVRHYIIELAWVGPAIIIEAFNRRSNPTRQPVRETKREIEQIARKAKVQMTLQCYRSY